MRVSKIICDGCGREITVDPILIYAEKVDRETGNFSKGSVWNPDKDFCDDCMERIKLFVDNMNNSTEVESSDSNRKVEVNEKKPKNEKLKEQNKKPTVRELIIAGVEKEDVLKRTGCTPHTYDNTKCKLKKQGLIKENNKPKSPVKCSEKGKNCKYSANVGGGTIICDYLGKVGHSRGCDPEQCNKFEKR